MHISIAKTFIINFFSIIQFSDPPGIFWDLICIILTIPIKFFSRVLINGYFYIVRPNLRNLIRAFVKLYVCAFCMGFLALMASKLKNMPAQDFLLPMDHKKLKKFQKSKKNHAWPLFWPLKIFGLFFNFCGIKKVIQDMPKMTLLPWAQHHSWKSQEVWKHLDHSLRNGSRTPERRVDSTPPHPRPY